MTKKRSTKVPSNLQDLAAAGQRVRFNGFWLSDNIIDRTIADWLDNTPRAGYVIKMLLYQMITKREFVSFTAEPEVIADQYEETIGDAGKALMDLDD